MPTKLARFTERVVLLAQKVAVGDPDPAFQQGECGYVDWVIVAPHGLREYLGHPYRRLLNVLHEMPRIVEIIGLEVAHFPDFSTVCLRKQQLKMPVWHVLLRLSAELHDLGEIQAIDATGLDRVATSHHYANRPYYTFKAVNTTALIDCKTGSIFDMHCSIKQRHDSQISWQILKLNIEILTKITADKAYDWRLLCQKLRAEGVKPVIKHHEFDWHGVANNALLDDRTYHQRSNVEPTFSRPSSLRRHTPSLDLVRPVPRSRPESCRQKHRTGS